MSIQLLALNVAKTQVGVAENPKGSNAGKEVEAYLRSVGLGKGYAWCQAFVYWCYQQAAVAAKVPNPVFRTAGVLDCLNKTKPSQILTIAQLIKEPKLIKTGMQFIMDFGKGTGHTGLIEGYEVTRAGIIIRTIEGNTNDDGSREGYEVARRQRKIDSFRAVIKYE